MSRTAHAFGASVEAELGYTPSADEHEKGLSADYFTDPQVTAEYVAKTGVDALAVSVGTAHGQYRVEPQLDYSRIRAITDAVQVPPVLHGGSGLSDSAIREAIQSGISKIDIFTDINIACYQGASQAYNDGVRYQSEVIPYQVHAVKVAVEEKIRLFANR